MKILIIKPSSLGDIIHSLPVVVMLKKLYNNCEIWWLVFDKFSEILEENPFIDGLIIWKRKNAKISSFINVIKEIRQKKFQLIIDLQGLLRTALLSILSGAEKRIGSPGMKELSYLLVKEVKKFDMSQHAVERNLEVINYIKKLYPKYQDIDTQVSLKNTVPISIFLTNENFFPIILKEEDKNFARKFLSENGFNFNSKLIGILPAAGIKQKMWDIKNFSKLCDNIITKLSAGIIFFGCEEDCIRVNNIIRELKYFKKEIVFNACSKTTLKEMTALMQYCYLVIGNDTGPLHIATTLDIPCIGLYGPSDPKQLAPYNKKSIVFYKSLNCSPCGTNPDCTNNKCMSEITPDEVFKSVQSFTGNIYLSL